MSRIGNYLRDTQAEMKHVSWPTRHQALVYTALVIAIAGITAVYTSGFDYLFSKILSIVVG